MCHTLLQVVLETEITNRPALRLYENLGFVRDKRLFRYYLNGVDALREDSAWQIGGSNSPHYKSQTSSF